jgi:acyl transferase domain-containing protein
MLEDSSGSFAGADVCYAINTGQRHLKQRAAVTARTREQMIACAGRDGDG